MLNQKDLVDLVYFKPEKHVFTSVYLDTSPESGFSRTFSPFFKRRVSEIESLWAEHKEKLAEFRENIRKIKDYLDNDLSAEAHGVALFSCAAQDFTRFLEFRIKMPNRVVVDKKPHVVPLVELLGDRKKHLVVVLDSKHGLIYMVHSGEIESEKEIAGEVPGRTKVGGWSQMRYQRHRKDHIKRCMKELAEAARHEVKKEKPDDLIVLGSETSIAGFVKYLPDDVKEMIIHQGHIESHSSDHEVMENLQPLLKSLRKEYKRDLLERFKDRLSHGYLVASGGKDVVKALLEGRTEKLLLGEGQKVRGSKCADCGYLFSNEKADCIYCAGKCEDVDLIEEIVEAATKRDVSLSFVPRDSGFRMLGGVGAFLRY